MIQTRYLIYDMNCFHMMSIVKIPPNAPKMFADLGQFFLTSFSISDRPSYDQRTWGEPPTGEADAVWRM